MDFNGSIGIQTNNLNMCPLDSDVCEIEYLPNTCMYDRIFVFKSVINVCLYLCMSVSLSVSQLTLMMYIIIGVFVPKLCLAIIGVKPCKHA